MESATSGQIASLITDTEGASAVLRGAYVTYCNDAKVKCGVPAEVIGHMMSVVPEVARLKGVGESGYRTVVNTGPDSAATVNHLHIHVLGGTKMGRFTFEGSYREAQ